MVAGEFLAKHLKKKIEEVFDEIISTLPSHCLTEIEQWKSVTDVHLISDLAQASSPPLALTFLRIQRTGDLSSA